MDEAGSPQLNSSCAAAERTGRAGIASGEQSALLALPQRDQRPLFASLLRLVHDASLVLAFVRVFRQEERNA